MADGGIALLPNLGGEEGPGWRDRADEPAVRRAAALWRWLFGPDATLLYGEAAAWPGALGPTPEGPVFAWLAGAAGVVPWIATEDAAADRRVAGRSLWGPPPGVVADVHDKAFALAAARDEGLLPAELADRIEVFDPAALADADAFVARLRAALAAWPGPWRRRFTLKPRTGTSGRGRVAGEGAQPDTPALRGALPRLARAGGALLEPWLERRRDLSAQLFVDATGGVTLLGTLAQRLTPAGGFLGHAGETDTKGRIYMGHARDEAVRETAVAVAQAARARGFSGPCGVDAFTYDDPETGEERLRAVVELNARFTTGTVTVGLVRRALPRVKRALRLRAGERVVFHLSMDGTFPDGAGPDATLEARARRLGDAALHLPLVAGGPALLFHRSA